MAFSTRDLDTLQSDKKLGCYYSTTVQWLHRLHIIPNRNNRGVGYLTFKYECWNKSLEGLIFVKTVSHTWVKQKYSQLVYPHTWKLRNEGNLEMWILDFHSCQLWEMKMREILYVLEADERSELFGFGGALYEPPVVYRGGAPGNFWDFHLSRPLEIVILWVKNSKFWIT